jgi:DNA/RNA-binding domain of Phe-tRNA-synthetase-like protein
MKFSVSKEVFQKMDNVCFGIVVAKGINNEENKKITELLKNSIELTETKFQYRKVKEVEEIVYYRDSFVKLDINPNKFMSSIEAIITRIAKKKGFPSINPIVDLGNAVSIKYLVPLGAHDIEASEDDICIRFSKNGDSFIPFGGNEEEYLEDGELIYSVGNEVRTRKWIWRQSEQGKITKESKNIFFPIDGFKDKNYNSVINARDELAELLKKNFNCQVKVGFVDINNTEFEF